MMVAIRAETTMMVSNLKKGKKSMRVGKLQFESVSGLHFVFISKQPEANHGCIKNAG